MSKQSFTTGQVLTAAQVNTLQANDFNQTVSVKTANYTLAAADKGTRIEFNTSGSVTCTVNSGLFDAGDTLVIQNRGAGTATITAGTATVNTSASLALAQYSAGTLYFVSDSAALFFGDAAGISASIVDAKGDLIVGTADNTVGRLAVGTNGYTLVANSSEATGLEWAAPASGGGMTLINTGGTALTGASVTVSSIPGTYKHLYVIMEDVYQATTAGGIKMRFNSDTGSNYTFSGVRNINTTLAGTSSTTTSIQLETRTGSTNTANKKAQVQVWLPRYTNTTPKALHSQSYGHDDTNPSNFAVSATYVGGSAISSITVFGDYNFSGGTIYVYGVN